MGFIGQSPHKENTMARNKPYEGVYANMDFEAIYGPKQFLEYPKHVKTGPTNNDFKTVYSAKEERELLATLKYEQDNPSPEQFHATTDNEKEILITRAHELGVPINRKWSKGKLQQVITDAENEFDNLPAEGAPQKTEYVSPVGSQVIYDTQLPTIADDNELVAENIQVIDQEAADADEKAELIAEAKMLGINNRALHLFGIVRLKAEIAEARAKVK
jgi:hypothetical protein